MNLSYYVLRTFWILSRKSNIKFPDESVFETPGPIASGDHKVTNAGKKLRLLLFSETCNRPGGAITKLNTITRICI